ncbi:MAG TPA: cell division protein FtsZ [Rhodospirillaceae bacterium]|nr:cell division protein FtsZ [Rhodospirillaceae bacterium]
MINIKMQPTRVQKLSPKITVLGVGGAGGNAVNNMISSGLEGCEFVVCNTDAQALENSLCAHKVQLGATVTGGLGAGSRPEIGQAAAEETLDEVMHFLEGSNMAFVTAGMGGGTGTGAAPVIAKACREKGILTVGVVTKPFHFEGAHRMDQAERGIEEMQGYVDTLIIIPNQNLFRIANERTTFAEGFKMADSVLQSGVRGVTDLMVKPGLVNLDFADIRTAMLEMGKAMMGTGEATGDKRAIEAAEAAINNPLLDDVSMKGARGVIINVTGGMDMTLFEADEACNRIRDEVDPRANIIFGATFDDSMEGRMRVSIVATGIEKESERKTGTGGGVRIEPVQAKATSRVQGKMPGKPLGRVQPKTVYGTGFAAERARPAPSAETAVSALTGAAPVRNVAPPPVSSPPAQEPEADMFEQQIYAAAPEHVSADVELPQNTALRGSRYKDSFIPPAPIEPEGRNYISNFHGAHAYAAPQQAQTPQPQQFQQQPQVQAPVQQPVQQQAYAAAPSPVAHRQTQTGSMMPTAQQPTVQAQPSTRGLQLNPPKLPSGPKPRSPSLFERITGSVQQRFEGLREDLTGGSSSQHQQQQRGPAPQPQTPPRPAQGSLNIDAPAGAPQEKGESELDIPAFLRRQAN